ncbi:endonuclease domain-containing protein [Sphingomonas metalli]|uniref:endonuclease domain-containing protein n=1 Tax=Sphingomonas metalli TaxID=1779358 RepID=UPI001E508E8E|nr:DUF559 domain-containing protein [Sphingomonas metalli]
MRSYNNHRSGTVQHARQLRREAPEPERRLLRALREAFPHLKWRHQASVGPFFADILCFSERLVIEVDGDTHAASQSADAQRMAYMAREGYRTIRVTNADVVQNIEGVIQHVSFSLREKEGAHAQHGKDEDVAGMKMGGTA